jgi:hypothetical protein
MLTRWLNRNRILSAALALLLGAPIVQAQSTAFTYQGKLSQGGTPANGNYDLQFTLFTAPAGGAQLGATLTYNPVTATAGVFSVALDFGASVFDGAARWLEIGVRPAGSGDTYTVLAPRQPVTAVPYAIQTLSATNAQQLGGLPASQYIASDASGNVGIGTTPSGGNRLDVNGNARLTTANGAVITFASPNTESGMSTIFNGGRADLRFDGATLKLVAGLVGGPPSATSGIIINTDGNVGIGTTNLTEARLQVEGFAAEEGIVGTSLFGNGVVGRGTSSGVRGFSSTNGGRGVYGISINGVGVEGSSNGGNNFGVFSNGYLGVDRLGAGGNTTMCRNSLNQMANCSSSLRYKRDVQTFDDGFSFIKQLRPIVYKWKADNLPDIGFGAEDVAKINPLFITYNDKGEVEGVKYDRLSVVFVTAFKEQQTQIEGQQRQLDQQQRQLENLKKLICPEHPDADVCRQK